MYAFFFTQGCSPILYHLVNIFAPFPLDIHYSLGFINSFLASSDFCCLLIAFANSLDPGKYRQNVCPDLYKDRLPPSDTIHVYLKEFPKKLFLEKKSADDINY